MDNFFERLKGHWPRYLVQFPFEWWVTLSFRNFADGKAGKSEYAKSRLKSWTRKLCKEERLQIAYIAVINEVNHIHLHLLMLGKNRHGKTLLDVPIDKWKKKWNAHSDIQLVYDIEGVSSYLSDNLILRNGDLSEVLLYNIKLLKKVQISNNLIKLDGEKEWDFNTSLYVPNVDKKSVQSQMVELIDSLK